ncbi:hypothetical protein Tco_0638215 [Tanacetum coccineum]
MLEREKLFGTNFNDWFRQLRIVLRAEKKLNATEQPIPHVPIVGATNQELEDWNKIYDVHNEEEGKSVSSYILKMKSYVEQLECLGYVLPQDINVGLILNDLINDFVGFVRNYNMHSMRKTIGELHTLLIVYEKGLPKKAATPQVLAIHGCRIQKPNKKPQAAKGKGK